MAEATESTATTAGFVGVLRLREYRLLWLASVQSLLGDQIARVALSILVFDRTGSGLAAAAVYSLTFLPALLGGVLLGFLADRLPRRELLIGGDVIRGVLLGGMAIPHQSVPILAALLFLAVLVGAPWKAAEFALVVDVLPVADHPVGLGLRAATGQAAQLCGFAAGGFAVATVGPYAALAVDGVTFGLSAAIIGLGVRGRRGSAPADDRDRPEWAQRPGWLDGARAVSSDPRLRQLLAFSWLLGLIVVPEGIAAPYAAEHGGGPIAVGLLLAAGPAGVLAGTVFYARLLSAQARADLLAPFAATAGVPLILCVISPGLPLSCALWALAGGFTGYQVQVVTEFARTIAPAVRGQGIAIASAGLLGAQGIGLLAGGVVSQLTRPTIAVAAAGAVATSLGVGLAVLRHRHPRTTAATQLSQNTP